MEFTLQDGHVTGRLECGNEQYQLEGFSGIYVRLMDDLALPELAREPESGRIYPLPMKGIFVAITVMN
jgi:hypothetical protein